ncbi:MAG: M28 family peptidase [Acidobacteriota bacterium]
MRGCPGANDSTTGVAALLSIARAPLDRPQRTLRLVFFVNEEPPHFQGPEMGSLVYARTSKERGERIVAMLSLETLGCYSDAPRSQAYPFPFSLIYPSTGNFVGFVGDVRSRHLVRRVIGTFRREAAFPSEGVAAPASIPGIGWSDQWSFWQQGYPAVMVTDTAPFRYGAYHTRDDTPEKCDLEKLARVATGLRAVVADLVR